MSTWVNIVLLFAGLAIGAAPGFCEVLTGGALLFSEGPILIFGLIWFVKSDKMPYPNGITVVLIPYVVLCFLSQIPMYDCRNTYIGETALPYFIIILLGYGASLLSLILVVIKRVVLSKTESAFSRCPKCSEPVFWGERVCRNCKHKFLDSEIEFMKAEVESKN